MEGNSLNCLECQRPNMRINVKIDVTHGQKVSTVALTTRLLRAAKAAAWNREYVDCQWLRGDGQVVACQLLGPGARPGTVRIRTWYNPRLADQAPITKIALPPSVAQRLEEIAAQQKAA